MTLGFAHCRVALCGRRGFVLPRPRRMTLHHDSREAMTLLETMLTMSMLSVIALLSAQAVFTTRTAWDIQDQRSEMFQHLGGLLGHVTRQVRMSHSIVTLSDPAVTSGFLSITLPDDSVVKWAHDGVDFVVRYGADPPTELLATGIDSLKFECFELDGLTTTIVPGDVRMIRVTASATLPVQGTSLSLSSTIWIRKQQDALTPPFDDFYAMQTDNPPGWADHTNLRGQPDGLVGVGGGGARVRASGFDTTGYTGVLGTVLVGFYFKTGGNLDNDLLEVYIERESTGPTHSYGKRPLRRFENSIDWLWINVTDDFAGWTYADIAASYVEIVNQDAGSGGTTIEVDSLKFRSFVDAPTAQVFWMTGLGSDSNEWVDQMAGLGAQDGAFAQSNFEGSNDRQSYAYTSPWEDLGAIVRVRLLLNYYVGATILDDEVECKLSHTADNTKYTETLTAAVLNLHVGVANQGTTAMDFSGYETWTWPSINSYEVLVRARKKDGADGLIYVDAVGLEVQYVEPTDVAVVLWEEL